ncbi:plakophilin-1-like [Echeneis naucrates]|uniref:Plakophilin-1-like n=1 Tax=Echeneis naucrates TaxID=173247 RepID=A0A665TDC2_ECHNA|nr:plakophilin-1-like [Echeneis naucrates]
MMSLDPLKSALSIGNLDDTSLAVPSEKQHGSGQQRVLEQVQTIRRIKSRSGTRSGTRSGQSRTHSSSSRSGSASLSPTSPVHDVVFKEGLKSYLTMSNPGIVIGNGFSKSLNQEKTMNRQTLINSKGVSMKMNTGASGYQYERILCPVSPVSPVSPVAVGQPNSSRSEPDLPRPQYVSIPRQRFLSSRATRKFVTSDLQYMPSRINQQKQPNMNGISQTKASTQFVCSQVDSAKRFSKYLDSGGTVKVKAEASSNGNRGATDLTMKEAVECLSSDHEAFQHCGASYIQHNVFVDDNAKEEVLKLNGIRPLVGLLRSPNSQVSQTASAALRNLSFKNNNTKEAIHENGGITVAADLLSDTDSAEIKKQLTGLLWNLSSSDNLKPDLLKSALPSLMENVILPYTTGPNRAKHDPELFFNATGCLRNLSSAKQNNRQAMRKCRGLVDSLVSYVQDCVEAGKPDEKSVENCMCILHNLTFQLEDEAAALFSNYTKLAKTLNRSSSQENTSSIGCFSPQSKSPVIERQFDIPINEEPNPSGAGLLLHSKTLQTYLKLLGSSKREETLEACSGALQNLTANEGIFSSAMCQIIVQKLKGLNVISDLLKSNKANIQKNTVALVGNMTRNPNLRSEIAEKTLPELTSIITAHDKGDQSDETLAMACQATNSLILKRPDLGNTVLNRMLINSLTSLSGNTNLKKASKAASLLLYNMWSDNELQSVLKRRGMTKASFINDVTTMAMKSVQVVE